jgi:hypothetical protein
MYRHPQNGTIPREDSRACFLEKKLSVPLASEACPIVSYTYAQPKYTDCRGRLLQAQPHKYSHSPAIRLPWEKALKGNIPPYFCALSPPPFKLGTGSNTNLQWSLMSTILLYPCVKHPFCQRKTRKLRSQNLACLHLYLFYTVCLAVCYTHREGRKYQHSDFSSYAPPVHQTLMPLSQVLRVNLVLMSPGSHVW